MFYKAVCWLALLILVMPSTNAASERSFSVMRTVKSYLRSSMQQSRLNHLMTLTIYKEDVKKLEVANEFWKLQTNFIKLHMWQSQVAF